MVNLGLSFITLFRFQGLWCFYWLEFWFRTLFKQAFSPENHLFRISNLNKFYFTFTHFYLLKTNNRLGCKALESSSQKKHLPLVKVGLELRFCSLFCFSPVVNFCFRILFSFFESLCSYFQQNNILNKFLGLQGKPSTLDGEVSQNAVFVCTT